MNFYKNKNVLITGHTGFKGAWLAKTLEILGAKVTGYALEPKRPSIFRSLNLNINSIIGDIRDTDKLQSCFNTSRPEIIFHLAAQPLVSEGYAFPKETYETNIMGTVNVLECARLSDSVKSAVVITTDKVYKSDDTKRTFCENDILDGFDPYSNSKSCSDIITRCYRDCFFKNQSAAVSSARAGNVIGGGDFAKNRIIPDCIRAAIDNRDIIIRNPNSVRPYQYIMDTLYAYLLIAKRQYEDRTLAESYNIAPVEYVNNARLADLFCKAWGNISWRTENNLGFHETEELKIDGSKIKSVLGFEPKFDIQTAIEKTVEWTKIYSQNGDINAVTEQQIKNYIRG